MSLVSCCLQCSDNYWMCLEDDSSAFQELKVCFHSLQSNCNCPLSTHSAKTEISVHNSNHHFLTVILGEPEHPIISWMWKQFPGGTTFFWFAAYHQWYSLAGDLSSTWIFSISEKPLIQIQHYIYHGSIALLS